MQYYVITEECLYSPIIGNRDYLEEKYPTYNVLQLPSDYAGDKYIISNGVLVLNPNYDTERLAKAKQNKYNEALTKANEYQQEGFVEYKNCVFEMSDSNRKNLSDTEEALKLMGETETTWLDKDDNYIVLTVEDIQYIRLNLILATIQQLWIVKYPSYKEAIANAETVEEVEAIVIDYTSEVRN